jgi:sulfite reductase (NADPH) flavoprotein alpha-component
MQMVNNMLSMLRVENSPFNEDELKNLNDSIGALSPIQSQWLSGYLAGRVAEPLNPGRTQEPRNAAKLNIIYATETGHSESIATALAENLQQQGVLVKLQSMDKLRPASLRKLTHVAFVISTHGEGDAPDEALEWFEYLESDRAASLKQLNYRILALGDKSYQHFCEAGRQLDKRLLELGAQPFGERIECDVDYSQPANTYSDEILQYARENLSDKDLTGTSAVNHLSLVPTETSWTRENPFSARLVQTQRVTSDDSSKEVFHLELSLDDSDIRYQPGDALAVWAPNDTKLVDRVLESLDINASSTITLNERNLTIREALISHLEITRLNAEIIQNYAEQGQQEELKALISTFDAGQQQEFLEQRQMADLVHEYPAKLDAGTLVGLLRPISPRSYSIASSQELVDEEVHLTVATLRSNAIGTTRRGTASGFLNHRLEPGEQLKVFLEPNSRFRLPENPETPIVMIAAGTGIAPFRAFMQELEERTKQADSWLIFGNTHLRNDFLYQREWLRWRETGLLNRIDTAWSRDQAEKRYVQHVVSEQAERIERWLQRGAHIYICGSLAMGQAVQQQLQAALAEQRGIAPESATSVLKELQKQKRLKKDLY